MAILKGLLKNRVKKFVMVMQKRYKPSPAVQQFMALSQIEVCSDPPSRGLILGVFADECDKEDPGLLTPTAWRFNVERTNHRMLDILRQAGPMPKIGEARLFFGIEPEKVPYYSVIAVVGLGKQCLGYHPYEIIDEQKEAIRRSTGFAIHEMMKLDTERVEVESLGHAESAAEGAALGIWKYQELRQKKCRWLIPTIDLFSFKDEFCDIEGWRIGLQKAAAQNLTRRLQDMPSNLLTPTAFAQEVVDALCKSGVNVEVKVEGWALSQSMTGFLAAAKASCEPPVFLELSYYGTGAEERPIVLVGQGCTYDSGGLCKKEYQELKHMRADLTGAAVVVATCRAVANLRLPVNIRGLVPLCENVIGCNSFHPGDIVRAVNNRHIEIQGTDHEDMLIIGDALLYAQNFCPKYIVDIGQTSGGMIQALDETASGIFTNSEILWQQIKHASMHTGDRVWRFPLWDYYSSQVKCSGRSDVMNYGCGRRGRPCKAAAFLREFVPCGQWMHIDCTNVVVTNGKAFEYLQPGMAGRPTRTLVEFIAQSICKDVAPKLQAKKP